MKSILIIGLGLVSALPALGQWDKILQKKSTVRITCFSDVIMNTDYGDGKPVHEVFSGKTSEAVRTSITKNGVEYRSGTIKAFDENGARLASSGTYTGEFRSVYSGDQVTEYYSLRSQSQRYSPSGETSAAESKHDFVHTYQIDGNKRYLLKILTDGKDESSSMESVEETITIDANTKMTKTIDKTPYILETEFQGQKIKTEYLKSESNCTYEKLN